MYPTHLELRHSYTFRAAEWEADTDYRARTHTLAADRFMRGAEPRTFVNHVDTLHWATMPGNPAYLMRAELVCRNAWSESCRATYIVDPQKIVGKIHIEETGGEVDLLHRYGRLEARAIVQCVPTVDTLLRAYAAHVGAPANLDLSPYIMLTGLADGDPEDALRALGEQYGHPGLRIEHADGTVLAG